MTSRKCEATIEINGVVRQCTLDWIHDDPYAEMGSRQRVPLHQTNFKMDKDGITKVYVEWRTPGLFGEDRPKL